jgi:hypothetical protein
VELALVLPVLLLLGLAAAAIVQVARTQLALAAAASAAALVAARAPDATAACTESRAQLATSISDSGGLIPSALIDRFSGRCSGPLPSGRSPADPNSYFIWLGLGGVQDTFCRRGTPVRGPVTDGDVVVSLTYRPNLSWLPLVGSWLSPELSAQSVQKVDPFRSRDPSQDPTGDNC